MKLFEKKESLTVVTLIVIISMFMFCSAGCVQTPAGGTPHSDGNVTTPNTTDPVVTATPHQIPTQATLSQSPTETVRPEPTLSSCNRL